MQQRTLQVLEFDKIREILAQGAVSEMGRALCLALQPETSFSMVNRMQAQTEEAAAALARLGYHPVPAFENIAPQLKKVQIGSVLSARELLLCANCMRAARSVRQVLVREGEHERTSIEELAQSLVSLREVEQEISRAILSEEEIADQASPELASVRRQIRAANERIREKLNAYLHNANLQRYLQESVVTMRAGRYVLPVRQEYRQQVPGLIHDQSATGSTLFIEPMAVVELGNDIKQLQSREYAEIERILAALSAMIEPYAKTLEENLATLAHLDFVFAKGALSRLWRCSAPKMNDRGWINIIRGRHPLIDAQTVVPSNLWIGKDFSTLVVTGPNTGGKTVTLKTVGLFALMAQAGLQVPADLGTELCIFDQIFADIGDEQSIEQSLSTFSSHMTNIVHILNEVTPGSLVLFDELGAGTDPTEGASLAQAILDTLLKKRIMTLATTHYSELKAYALTTQGVQNASVEFDVETLRPTYRLFIGIPGKSNAFEISKRLGLSAGIIQQARTHLSSDQLRFEDVLSNAEYHRQVAEKERKIAQESRLEITRLQNEIEAQRAKLEEQKQGMLKKAREEARCIVNQARAQSEQVLSDLKKTAAEQSAIARGQNDARQRLDALSAQNSEVIAQNSDLTKPPKSVKPGDSVRILTIGAQGTVLTPANERGQVQVQAGIMKMTVDIGQLRLIGETKKEKGTVRQNVDMASRSVPLELDVRGQLLEEAIDNVDKYLDDAYLASRKEVSIIHGKGTGALRKGLWEYFRHHPHVASYRSGNFGEGETGVTVVKLK
jgi:DNA mismatch repair protein MutS2